MEVVADGDLANLLAQHPNNPFDVVVLGSIRGMSKPSAAMALTAYPDVAL